MAIYEGGTRIMQYCQAHMCFYWLKCGLCFVPEPQVAVLKKEFRPDPDAHLGAVRA
jgi:hypothetical protein